MATYILNHPETGVPHCLNYEVTEVITDHLGNEVMLTDWHVLHPKTQEQMGVTKPVEILEYLWYLREYSGSPEVQDFFRDAVYFLTDGCVRTWSPNKNTFIRNAKEYMEQYTQYRAPYHLWTRVWTVVDDHSTARSSYSGILDNSNPEVVYTLELYLVRVTRTSSNGSSPSSHTPSCADKWLGKKSYSAKMNASEHNFFRHLDNEFYDSAHPAVGVPMFGLELEVSTRLHPNELQYIVCDIEPKQEPFFIMKDDSSITGSQSNRYEIVTVPATPRYLKKAFSILFKKIETLCASSGKQMSDVFDMSTDLGNGIHIHVDRRSFHNNRQKTHISRFLSAFNLGDEQTATLFSHISRRPGDYRTATYCAVDRNLSRYTTGHKLKEASKSDHRGCTSMRQSSTVEVRIFQGIVDINHIRSCIEATQAMMEYTYMMPLSTLNRKFAPGFREFVLKSGKYNNLRKELK